MGETETQEWREINSREADGGKIKVNLFWLGVEPPEFRFDVDDGGTKTNFSVLVKDPSRIDEVFNNPMRFEDIRVIEAPEQGVQTASQEPVYSD